MECKCSSLFIFNLASNVLILTYWNVNQNVTMHIYGQTGINLNLLECKSVNEKDPDAWSKVLILTYWNVNRG